MAIIVEGLDASGKSTLGAIVGRNLGYTVIESEGPPKYKGEMNHRLERYLALPNAVFVRHPAVSQVLYGRMRNDSEVLDEHLVREVYSRCRLFIYCDPLNRGLINHRVKDGESTDHVRAIHDNYDRLLRMYREWAIEHAHVIYRIGDDVQRVVRLCLTIK